MFDEEGYAEVEPTYDDTESPAHVNRQEVQVPTKRHLDLYRLLQSTSHVDEAGRLVSWWPQPDLAAKLQTSVRTLRNVLADLREPGLDPRHPRGRPPGLRLGLIRVEGTTYLDTATGRHRLGGNLYVLVPGLQATLAAPAGQTAPRQPDSPAHVNRQAGSAPGQQATPDAPPRERQQATPSEPILAAHVNRQEEPVACLNKGNPPLRGEDGVLQPVGGTSRRASSRQRRRDPTAAEVKAELARLGGELVQQREASVQVPAELPPARFPRVELRVPAGHHLDHDPTAGEVRNVLAQAFGQVEVVEFRPRPTYKAARHRTFRLDGSLDDFHTALDLLERDTCASETDHCVPGRLERCRRHTRRSERRPGAAA
jgi:hypothetical protein